MTQFQIAKHQRDELIWRLHTRNFTHSEIAVKVGMTREWVCKIISKLRKKVLDSSLELV